MTAINKTVLLVFCISVIYLAGAAYAGANSGTDVLPLDKNNDQNISSDELSEGILSYLAEKYLNKTDTEPDENLSDAAYIYANWGGKPKTITDSTGRTITLYRPLKNVVVLNGEMLETLRSLNFSSDKISGVGKYTLQDTNFFPEYSKKTNVGSVWSPDYEKIIELKPDAVLTYATFMQDTCDEIQQKVQGMDPSIKFIRFDLYYPSTYIEEAEKLSKAVDREEEGEKLVSFYGKNLDLIKSKVGSLPEDNRTKVYFESWDDYKSAAKGSGYNEKINLAGGFSIFENATPEYPIVSPEEILLKNPDVIVKLIGSGQLKFGGYEDNDTDSAKSVYVTLTSRAGWSSLDAVKDNRLHILSTDIFGGPEYIIGTLYLAKWFYPGEFEDVDPEEVHQEYVSDFQHLDYNVSSSGLFTYQETAKV
ncbi:iron complex transport system substrate-binding protein [Methanomicrobium sp. W14]|uniref:ABC transporter substrate-binding protein n=1 Tax=Methanomicrobium sp. W14 TaxID=2817839 RepID=UPI001AE767E5|nr:ABC transporter substrate-binding protein [Methanomicrobium sp. W14]MBP2134382.1 iron complex transport system substrate-binding protein [Methanomicrobium sp. W14]